MRRIGWVIFTTFFSFFIISQTSFSKRFEVRVSHTVKCLYLRERWKRKENFQFFLLTWKNFLCYYSKKYLFINNLIRVHKLWMKEQHECREKTFISFLIFSPHCFCWLNNEKRDGIIRIEYWILDVFNKFSEWGDGNVGKAKDLRILHHH